MMLYRTKREQIQVAWMHKFALYIDLFQGQVDGLSQKHQWSYEDIELLLQFLNIYKRLTDCPVKKESVDLIGSKLSALEKN